MSQKSKNKQVAKHMTREQKIAVIAVKQAVNKQPLLSVSATRFALSAGSGSLC